MFCRKAISWLCQYFPFVLHGIYILVVAAVENHWSDVVSDSLTVLCLGVCGASSQGSKKDGTRYDLQASFPRS